MELTEYVWKVRRIMKSNQTQNLNHKKKSYSGKEAIAEIDRLIDEAIEYNKAHPQTFSAEEVKVEMRRRVAEKLAK